MKNKVYFIILSLIVLVAFAVRFYELGNVPRGLQQDESSIGYNAYSILQTGKDEYGKPYPLYFKAFGEYKLPGYIYGSILPIKFFGLNPFSVRLLSALSGFLTVVVFYFFITKLFPKQQVLALVATALLALNPWHIHFSRGAFEITPALLCITLGAYLLLPRDEKIKPWSLFFGILLMVISMYTYNIARLFTPLFTIFLLWSLYSKHIVSKSKLIILALFALFLLLPFALGFFSQGGVAATKGTMIMSSAVTQSQIKEMRSYFVDVPPLFGKIFFNTPLLTFWEYLKNIVSYFSAAFYFVSGSAHGNHGIGNVGLFYLFEFLTVLFGVWVLLSKTNTKVKLIVGIWALLVIFIASLTREAPQATRSFFLIIPMEIVSGMGLVFLFQSIQKWRMKYFFVSIASIFIVYNVVYYFASYYVRFPIFYAKEWRSADKEISEYIKTHQGEYDRIIFDTKAGFLYSSYLFYAQYLPSEFQQTVTRRVDDSEGFSKVTSFGKYEFKDVDFKNDLQPRTLIITTSDRKPKEVAPLHAFYFPKRPVVLALGQRIMEFPVEDIVYVLVEKK